MTRRVSRHKSRSPCASLERYLRPSLPVYDYGDETSYPEVGTRTQTARSDPVQSSGRSRSQASRDDSKIRARLLAYVVDRRRLFLHSAGIGRDRVVVAVSER